MGKEVLVGAGSPIVELLEGHGMKALLSVTLGLLVVASLRASVCQGTVVEVYDDPWQTDPSSVFMTCHGPAACGSGQTCSQLSAGDLAWCQCNPGGGGGVGSCVTVMVSNGGDTPLTRCANLACGGACQVIPASYTGPDGKYYVSKSCYCL